LHSKIFHNVLVFLIIFFVILLTAYSNTAAGGEYLLEGDDIRYDYQNNIISTTGDVVFRYQDLEVRTDSLIIDLQEGIIEARERVMLISADQKITGNYLYFDIEQRTGQLYEAESEIGAVNFSGGIINIYRDREYSLHLQEAMFTTCRFDDDPHYSIRAAEVRIYPEKRITGSEVSLWWRDNRLLQLPGYVVHYEEIDGEYEISHPFPVPSIGYSSQTGLTMEVIYPYQVGEEIQGQISLLLEQQGVIDLKLQNRWPINPRLTYISELEYYRNSEGDRVYGSYQGGRYQYTNDLLFESGINWVRIHDGLEVREEWGSRFYTAYQAADFKAAGLLNYDLDQKLAAEILYKEDNWQFEGEIDYLLTDEIIRSWARLMVETEWEPGENKLILENNFQQGAGYLGLETKQNWLPKDNLTLEFTGDLRYNFSEWSFVDLSQKLGTGITYASDYNIGEDLSLQGQLSVKNSIELQNFRRIIDYSMVLGTGINLSFELPEPDSFWRLSGEIAYEQTSGTWESLNIGLSREYDCFELGFNYDIGNDIIDFNINF